jgi:hypothetical protein
MWLSCSVQIQGIGQERLKPKFYRLKKQGEQLFTARPPHARFGAVNVAT